MKKDYDKDLDSLFKHGLEDPDYNTGYLEDDWGDLEKMLDKPVKRRVIAFWLPILSSAAAILLFLGWWMFRPQVVQNNQQKHEVTTIKTSNTTGSNKVAVNNTPANKVNGDQSIISNSVKGDGVHQEAAVKPFDNSKKQLIANNRPATGSNIPATKLTNNNGQNNSIEVQEVKNSITEFPGDARSTMTLAAVSTNPLIKGITGDKQFLTSTPVESKEIIGKPYRPEAIKDDNDNGLTKLGFVKRPQFALTVVGASELNGANTLGDAKSGTNVGLLFSAGVYNKLTLTTGANYAAMPYNTNIANYHTGYTFKTNPSEIEADCRVLDIPINLDYQLYNKHQNKFSIGTGLSSYIMLHESYQFYYADPTTKGPVAFTVPNEGKYFFGIMNLQATYTRQVNSKFGLSIQPYMKLPLTTIGYSQTRLQTAGVAVGLSWNINSLTKP